MKHATRIVLLLVTGVTIAVAAQESKSKPPSAAAHTSLCGKEARARGLRPDRLRLPERSLS